MQPDESVDHFRRGIAPEDSRQPADELADLELIRDDDAGVVTVFVGVAARFTDEIRNLNVTSALPRATAKSSCSRSDA